MPFPFLTLYTISATAFRLFLYLFYKTKKILHFTLLCTLFYHNLNLLTLCIYKVQNKTKQKEFSRRLLEIKNGLQFLLLFQISCVEKEGMRIFFCLKKSFAVIKINNTITERTTTHNTFSSVHIYDLISVCLSISMTI